MKPESGAQRSYRHRWALPLDREISYAVKVLRDAGVETYESCEGGKGHAFLGPTVRFHGDKAAGLRAVSVALQHGLPVSELHRLWSVIDGELSGPTWELTFFPRDRLVRVQRQAERAGLLAEVADPVP